MASARYTAPIQISKTTVLRARACPDDALMSPVAGVTYIIGDPAVTPVVSLSTDEKYLYDSKIGIFVRGSNATSNYEQDWEYPVHLEYFDENGEECLNQTGSFHIVGTSTRGAKHKSIAVYARTAYGDGDRFCYNPFENRDYESYKTLILRSSGSDAMGARMRDAVLTSMADGLDLMYQASRPVVVYMNGVYMGHYNLREKINKYSVAQWEGVTKKSDIDAIDIVEGEARDNQVQNGDNADWLALRKFVRENDLNDPENLQFVTDRLDVDSLFTWTCFELCIMNQDLENVRIYRVPGGKWKYILYDLDGGGVVNERGIYMLLDSSRAGSILSSQYSLIKKLIAVPQMRARFLTRLAQVIDNSFLYAKTAKPAIDEWQAVLEQLLPRHYSKYKDQTMSAWRNNVNAFRTGIRIAPKRALTKICECLNVTEAEKNEYFKKTLEDLAIYNAQGI